MKTHELSRALTQLGKILRSLPDQEITSFGETVKQSGNPLKDVGISLSALAALSKYTKTDWEKVVQDFEIPVEIRARDAARDVMGKLLTYLAENDDERHRIALKGRGPSEPTELANALRFLLSND